MASEARGGDTRIVIKHVMTDFQFDYFSAWLFLMSLYRYLTPLMLYM